MLLPSNQHSIDIQDIKGLICIDCWDDPELDSYYQKLNSIVDFDQFDSIIVASYEITLDRNDVALSNTLEEYSYHNYTPEILLPIVKETRDRTTSKYVQQHFKKHSFLLLDSVSFVTHATNCVPHVNDWLVIGGEWQMCTHNRPLGLHAMSKTKYNFYTGNDLIYHKNFGTLTRQMIEQDQLTWIDCANGLYQLHS
jgi:hypothetical protein